MYSRKSNIIHTSYFTFQLIFEFNIELKQPQAYPFNTLQ
jgi:hypothetical protein